MLNRMRQLIRERAFWVGLAVWTGIAVGFLAGASGCGHKATAKGDGVKNAETLAVATTTPRIETIDRSVVQPGAIMSYEETPIYAKIAGFLEKLNVDIGDKVKKDELLAELWVPEVAEDVRVKAEKIAQGIAAVAQAKEALKVAGANIDTWDAKVKEAVQGLDRANADVERWKHEYEVDYESFLKQILDQQTLDVAWNRFKASEASRGEAAARLSFTKASWAESKVKRDRAKADVQVSNEQLSVWEREHKVQQDWLDYAKIKAPFDGKVTRRFVHTGHFVQPTNSGTTSKASEPLFVVMRTDVMRVVVQVPESDAPLIRDGADAVVRIPSLRDREVHCKVTRSSWSLDVESRTLRVEIFLDNPLKNPAEELQPGLYVNVSIVANLPNVLTLPVDAILTDGDKNYCFVVEDGVAKRVNVKVGMQNERSIQLLSKQLPSSRDGEEGAWAKFTGNEKVIISQISSVRDGQTVAVK
jgi:HlyD family secretion protein